jgi:hypothetical protein
MSTAVNDVSSSAPVRAALAELLASQKTLKLATSGGLVSPWITGTYFSETNPFTLHFTLEKAGKGMANVAANPRVAVAVDTNNPFAIFAQGEGKARILTGAPADAQLAALRKKIPEIEPLLAGQLHVMAVDIQRWLVTSFPQGWFPAKVLVP